MGWSSGAKGTALGMTGATGAARFVGATASGAPTSGTFAVGDFAVDQTGKFYVCTSAGTPGTWVDASIGGSPPDVHDYQIAASDVWKPTGALAQTYDRMLSPSTSNASYFVSQTAGFSGIYLPAGITVTTATVLCGAAETATIANGWCALYDSSLQVIRQCTDTLAVNWGTNTSKSFTLDSVPVTAGARVASTTVTLTFPTLSQSVSTLFAVNDSIVVSNANIAAYNGTFTVTGVSGQTITYTAGSSATDSLASPFPTVQMAAGKRTYAPTAGRYYIALMQKATVGGLQCLQSTTGANTPAPIPAGRDATNVTLTGTAVSPAAALTANANIAYCYIT